MKFPSEPMVVLDLTQERAAVSPRWNFRLNLRDLGIRLLDIIISTIALVVLAPILGLIALIVRGQDNGPIFFVQSRIGLNGRTFKCFKFRSMHIDADRLLNRLLMIDPTALAEWEADHKLRQDPRVTPLGRILRKTSLDEFPQLFNVLRGDMSLVGPRPIIQAEVRKYSKSFRHYTSVPPGITGLWQVMGRNDVTYKRRVAMDRLFARRRSIRLYLYILVVTIPAVLTQRGSY